MALEGWEQPLTAARINAVADVQTLDLDGSMTF
jgi:hypothetical protein